MKVVLVEGAVMAKVIGAKITVAVDEAGQPVSFLWQGQRHVVKGIVDLWKEIGEWWDDATPRTVYKVMTSSHGVYELHWLHHSRSWWLQGIED